jgi:rubredoxin
LEGKVEKVKLHPETIWNWECPACGVMHEEFDDYEDEVICEDCWKTFDADYQK